MEISISERVGIKDIFLGLKNILGEAKSDKSEQELEDRIKKIIKVEAELGGTRRIEELAKESQTYGVMKKSKITKTKVRTQEIPKKENKYENEINYIDEIDMEK